MELKHLSRLLRCTAAAMAVFCAVGMTALAEEPATPETAAEPEVTAEAPAEESAPAEETSEDAEGEGVVPSNYTGLAQYQGAWRYFQDGKLNYDYVGVALASTPTTTERYYVKGSCVDFTYNGLALYGSDWYYFVNGYNDTRRTDELVQHINGWFYYLTDGRIDTSYSNKLKLYGSTWYYVRNGEVNPAELLDGAVVKHHLNGWYYYLNKGVINTSLNGLVWGKDYTDPSSATYGQVDRLWLMTAGECAHNYNGFYKYTDGKEYLLINSIWVGANYNSLVQVQGENATYLVRQGVKDLTFNGVYAFNNTRYKLTNGKVDTGFTGVAFDGSTGYYFKNGVFDASFNGTVNHGNGVYTVKNGIVSGNTNYGSPDADERQIFEEIKEVRKSYGNWNDPNYAYKYHNAAETLAKEKVGTNGKRPNGSSWTTVLDEAGWKDEKSSRSAALLVVSGKESLTDTEMVKLMMENTNNLSQVKNTKYNSIAVGRYVSGGYQYVAVLLMDL